MSIIQDQVQNPIVGAIANHQLRELTYPIEIESEVTPITMNHADGMRFYRRSLTFLLETVFHQLFPEALLTIDHSVASGGFFCQVYNRLPLLSQELDQFEAEMRRLVAENLPFIRKEYPLEEAIKYFKDLGYLDKVSLLKHRKKDHLILYSLGDHRDYHHGYMVPSTGYLKWFQLESMGDGFILRFPRRHWPTELQPLPDYLTLLETFRQYGDWLSRLGIDSVGALNDAILDDRIYEIVLVSEALHEQRIAEIAGMIAERQRQVRLILISGPSSSGKTTFSKRLSIQLLARGISPFPMEMDNYFVDRDQTPVDEDGELDFESVAAVNTQHLSVDLQALIAGKKVQLPHFDFRSGRSEPGETVQLLPGQIIILEGIHGLNPQLTPNIPSEQIFRVYASALTQLNLDRHNRVSTTDTRLIRRIVRDARDRGYSAQETIERWESVRRGEKRYIFPYQENADVMFNSALVYELAALKPLAEPVLRQVPFGSPSYIEAKRLLTFLEWFLPVDQDPIPDNSILKEFIGHSSLLKFKIWK
ncbi:MAG: nucleoside kinase [Anaerolineales bacterium]|nr:nucleoside kinase [Anaerolineales bacterium]